MISLFEDFSHQLLLVVFPWILSNRTQWLFRPILPLISGHRCLQLESQIQYLCQPGQQSPTFCKCSFFLLIIIRSGCLVEIKWSVCNSKSLLLLLSFTPLEFFTWVLADGFSLEFEWQQVSSSLQDSSQYSGHPQQCCRLDTLYPSANFQVLQAL